MDIAVITGASSGIGLELVRRYHREGCIVCFCARRKERIEALEVELNALRFGSAKGFIADVTQESAMEPMLSWCAEKNPRSLTLIANAGANQSGLFQNLSLKEYQNQFDVNVWSVIKTIKPFLPLLIRCKGKIAIVGSGNSYISLPGASPYCMSKFAVRAFADSLRAELSSQGVSVTLIVPGFIQSEIRGKDLQGVPLVDFKDPVPAWLEMKAVTAAGKMFQSIERRRAETWVTFHVKVFIWLEKFFPSLLRPIKNRLKV